MSEMVCPECGTHAARARVPEDGYLNVWWLVPAAVSAVLLLIAAFVAVTAGNTSVAGAGQSSATWLLGHPQIADSRIVKTVTFGDLKMIADGSIAPTFSPSDLRFHGDRRFQLDMLEAPLLFTAKDKIDGNIGDELSIGWPAPWLYWRNDRNSPDLQLPLVASSSPAKPPQYEKFWFFIRRSAFPSPEETNSVILSHTRVLIAPLVAFVLVAFLRLVWKIIRPGSTFPVGIGWLFIFVSLLLWLWPGRSVEVVSVVGGGPTYGETTITASDIFAMRDTADASRRIAKIAVQALENSTNAANPLSQNSVVAFGYSEFPASGMLGKRSPFSVSTYSCGIFHFVRWWRADGKPSTPPGSFVTFNPNGEVYIRTQSPTSIGMTMVSSPSILTILSLCLAPFAAIRLWRMSRADRLNRRHDTSSCLHCGYDLRIPAAPAQ